MTDNSKSNTPKYAEPVTVSELKIGSIYFMVDLVDDEMVVPVVETLVFLGGDIFHEGNKYLYFQDVRSHKNGRTIYDNEPVEDDEFPVRMLILLEKDIKNIFILEKMVDALLRCLDRYRKV